MFYCCRYPFGSASQIDNTVALCIASMTSQYCLVMETDFSLSAGMLSFLGTLLDLRKYCSS
jgi:hypothetical protein